jgi:hypothetical protein
VVKVVLLAQASPETVIVGVAGEAFIDDTKVLEV